MMTNTPTDAEIDEVTLDVLGYAALDKETNDTARMIARAVLAKWGQPAQATEPVAWLDPWTGTKVTTDYDAYGKHGIPLYTAPQPVVREPLTDAQIAEMMRDTWGCASIAPRHALEFARAVESAITAARATGKAGADWRCRMGADQDRQGP